MNVNANGHERCHPSITLRHAVALSTVPQALLRPWWQKLPEEDPGVILKSILTGGNPGVLLYLKGVYPDDPVEASDIIISDCERKGIGIIHLWSDQDGNERYPSILKNIFHPPLVLYHRGGALPEKSVAIVGTRKADPVSLSVTSRIVAELVTEGYAIVSGMAVGIDRQAHASCLENGGCTVGVLAQGMDTMYPYRNRELFASILDSGCGSLVTEYPPAARADKWTFVRRNRVISGLCLGTVVIKAAKDSGALITARHAMEQNRDVFACPGHAFDPSYEGCHDLIRSGAKIVSSTMDILDELVPGGSSRNRRSETRLFDEAPDHVTESLSDGERVILDSIPRDGVDMDVLAEAVHGIGEGVASLVTGMELKGYVVRHGNCLYRMR